MRIMLCDHLELTLDFKPSTSSKGGTAEKCALHDLGEELAEFIVKLPERFDNLPRLTFDIIHNGRRI